MSALPKPAPAAPPSETEFDYVIVGGGSAGCVMANRLSADGRSRVLLIEAGPDTTPEEVPDEILDSYPLPVFHGERYVWPNLKVRAVAGVGAPRLYEQGRVMGGGSSVNVQAANRGLPRDYDGWRDMGAAGWGWSDVLPYFRRLERDVDFDGPLHGDSGPLPIRRVDPSSWNGFARALADAFAADGHARLADQNGEFGDGYFPPAISNLYDRRVTTAMAYLDRKVRRRPNLVVLPGHQVERILFDAGSAYAVVATAPGRPPVTFGCRRLVLTAGALNTPALLLRSGIGPGGQLQTLGIACRADIPAVGRNLQDHPCLTFGHYLPPGYRVSPYPRRVSLVGLRYSSAVPGAPQSDMYLATSGRASWHALGARLGVYFLWCNQPFSRGELTLASPDPRESPRIELNLLSDPRDAARMADGVRRLAAISRHLPFHAGDDDLLAIALSPRIKALAQVNRRNAVLARFAGAAMDAGLLRGPLLRRLISQGARTGRLVADAEALAAFIRRHVFGVWHASGTCRMGVPGAADVVVDPSGKVARLDNVWIADASVMPSLPSANTNIPTVMIAEKISDGLVRAGG